VTIHTGGKKAVEIRYNEAEVAEGWYNSDKVYSKEDVPDNLEFMSFTLDLIVQYLTWRIPTVALSPNLTNTYDWDIDWGDGSTQRATGTSVYQSAAGVSHNYALPGEYTVTVRPHNPASTKWFAAYCPTDVLDYYDDIRRWSVIAIDGNITWRATRSSLSDTPAYEFGCWFYQFTRLASMGQFNLPQDLTTVGDYFCYFMFQQCNGSAFSMNSVFNLPQDITTVSHSFCYGMFQQCDGSAFSMNSIFQLPQGILTVELYFCAWMFYLCSGTAFNVNSVFQLLQNVTSIGPTYHYRTFHRCSGLAGHIAQIFGDKVLPAAEVNKTNSFTLMFGSVTNLTDDISTIPQLVQVSPYPAKNAFAGTNVVRGGISANW
jgi:hypothetical protein